MALPTQLLEFPLSFAQKLLPNVQGRKNFEHVNIFDIMVILAHKSDASNWTNGMTVFPPVAGANFSVAKLNQTKMATMFLRQYKNIKKSSPLLQ